MEFFVCWLLAMAITGGRFGTDAIHAVKGTTPPRVERARLRERRERERRSAAGAKPAWSQRGPARRYFAALWRDSWDTATAHHAKVVDEKRAGKRPTVSARLGRLARLLWEPIPSRDDKPKPAAVPPSEGTAEDALPEGRSFTEYRWECGRCRASGVLDDYYKASALVDAHICPDGVKPPRGPDPDRFQFLDFEDALEEGRSPCPPTKPTSPARPHSPNPGGNRMSAPTGEAVNYETALAALTGLAETVTTLTDHAQGLAAAITTADSHLDGVDAQRRDVAATTQTITEHLSALKVDAASMSGVAQAMDAMTAERVSELIDHLAAAKTIADEFLAALDTAAAGVEASRSAVTATYGNAAEVVASTGVDPAFLAA